MDINGQALFHTRIFFFNYPRNVTIYEKALLFICTVSVAYHLVENYRGNLILHFHFLFVWGILFLVLS